MPDSFILHLSDETMDLPKSEFTEALDKCLEASREHILTYHDAITERKQRGELDAPR